MSPLERDAQLDKILPTLVERPYLPCKFDVVTVVGDNDMTALACHHGGRNKAEKAYVRGYNPNKMRRMSPFDRKILNKKTAKSTEDMSVRSKGM